MPTSSLTTGAISDAGQGVMPAQVLAGPIWWFVTVIYVLTLLLAIYTAIDSRQATRREALDALPEPWWLYSAVSILYVVAGLGAWFTVPAAWRWIAAVPVLLTPVEIALGVAYLLRVVYPKPAAGAPASGDGAEPVPAAERAASDAPEAAADDDHSPFDLSS